MRIRLQLVLILLALLPAIACSADAPSTAPSPTAQPQEPAMRRLAALIREHKPVHIVLWGDSISEVGRSPRWHGGASSPDKNFGAVLTRELQAKYPQSSFTLTHAGIGGQNTYEGLGRLDNLAPLKPDLVIVEFGTNDTCYHFLEPSETGRALDEMLKRIKVTADVVCIGTAGNNPADPKFLHVTETIDATRRAAEMEGVPFVDMHAVMLTATDQAKHWADFHLNAMNCHPNDEGHEVWGKTIAEVIIKELAGAE